MSVPITASVDFDIIAHFGALKNIDLGSRGVYFVQVTMKSVLFLPFFYPEFLNGISLCQFNPFILLTIFKKIKMNELIKVWIR